MSVYRFSDIDVVRQDLKSYMPLDMFIRLADARYTRITGIARNQIEEVNDHLFKKCCDLDSHPVDKDGSRDSTASFTICPPKELWYCFGCGASGDRFEYISQLFNVTHMESIEICAEIENIDLSPYHVELTMEEKIKIQLFSENEQARDIAHDALLKNDKALSYLHGRGITDESIETFKIGYAPPLINGNPMFDELPNSIALQLNRKDQFNDAILFPITDTNGRMRYFQSRPFNPMPGMKYIGGDDKHPLFDNDDRMFGFNIAKHMLSKNGSKLVGVEGAPDCIACVQQGIVACGFLGTSINQHTFDLLDKYRVVELTLLLDGDKAGRKKSFDDAEKFLGIKTNVRLKVALMPEGYDPEEFINAKGADELKKCIDEAVYAIQYLIDSKWNNATTPTGKIEYMADISKYMVAVTDKVTKQIMITHIASKIGLDPVQVEDYYMQSAMDINGSKLYSVGGEEILLGEAMRDPEFLPELVMRFKDNDWYLLKHKHLFRILKSTEYTDVESIYMIAKNMNVDNIITYDWIESLHHKVGNVKFSLEDVEDKLMRRNALEILEKSKSMLVDMSFDTSLTIDQSTTNMYNVIHAKAEERIYSARNQVDETMDLITQRMANPVDIIGDSYGASFKLLDKYTLGNQNKTLTVVAANQSVGKTQLCENWAMSQSVVDDIPILWFSLEMDKIRMTYRNLAILSGIDATNLMTGNITLEEKQWLDECAIRLRNAPFYLTDKGHDLTESLAIARRMVQTKHIRKIYVDYAQLQYVSDKRTETRSRELGTISKAWKEFGSDMDVSVILVSQLGKQALDAATAEAEHGFGSYEIAQDADNYITLKDKSQEEIDMRGIDHGNKTMNISKNRMGQKTVLIDIFADGPNYRMSECGIQE